VVRKIFEFARLLRTESLKEPFTGMRVPLATPVLRASLRACCRNTRPVLLATMYFLMAADEEPVRSLRALMASTDIAR